MYRIFNNRFEAETAIPFPWGLPVIQEKNTRAYKLAHEKYEIK